MSRLFLFQLRIDILLKFKKLWCLQYNFINERVSFAQDEPNVSQSISPRITVSVPAFP